LQRLYKNNPSLFNTTPTVATTVQCATLAQSSVVGSISSIQNESNAVMEKLKSECEQEYQCGRKLYYGTEVPQNYEKAFIHLHKAAKLGHSDAQELLGTSYTKGVGVSKDEKNGIAFYLMAIKQGNNVSRTNLGVCYLKGLGVTKDEKRAAEQFELAAQQGYSRAQCYIGLLYKDGRGVSKNLVKAIDFLQLATKQKDQAAQYELGLCYEGGIGVAKDLNEACRYYKLSADQKNQKAITKIGQLLKDNPVLAQPNSTAILYQSSASAIQNTSNIVVPQPQITSQGNTQQVTLMNPNKS
jgi:TPR repeat protein